VHGRLVHLRNRGIAHLTPEEMKKSVTMSELRTLVEIVSRLTAILQHLCQSQMARRGPFVRRDRPYRGGPSPHREVKNRKHPAMERVMDSFR
jgi:hypothetical protein